MIRGPYINIGSDVDDLPKNKGNDMPNVNSLEFRQRFAHVLLDQGDLVIGDAYQEGAKIQYEMPYFEAIRCKDGTIEVTCYSGDNRSSYIKRKDLLPYFNTVSCGRISRTDYVIVDGHCFPSLVHAFLSMFDIDGKNIIPKPWLPYHEVISIQHLPTAKDYDALEQISTLKQQITALTNELSEVKKLFSSSLTHNDSFP